MTRTRTLLLTSITVITTILMTSIILIPTEAHAVDCSSPHCYAVARKSVDNLGGYAVVNINSNNLVGLGEAIANPVWVGFSGTNNWLEVGWQKGTGLSPCANTDAKFYTWDALDSDTGICVGSVSGSTVTLQVSDVNEDGYWGLLINGNQEDTVFYDERATRVTVGGESTHEDNSLDNGRSKSLQYVDPVSGWTSWTSPVSEWDDASYVADWYTQYTDFKYYGP